MTRSGAIEKVLAVAAANLHVRESPIGSNRGAEVEAMLKVCGLPGGYAWCAAFVAFCGVGALGSAWQVPRSADCDVLLAWAKRRGILHQSGAKRGDIFLMLNGGDPNDAHHTGFITGDADADGLPDTIEGNTNNGGSREGYGVFRRERADTAGMVLVRWWELIDDLPDVIPPPVFSVLVGGVKIAGIVRDNQVFVSVRELFTARFGAKEAGARLAWNAARNRPMWSGAALPSSVPFFLENTTAFVGLRSAAEWLEMNCVFDGAARTVTVLPRM